MIIVLHIIAVVVIFTAGYITCGLLTRNTIHEEYIIKQEYEKSFRKRGTWRKLAGMRNCTGTA